MKFYNNGYLIKGLFRKEFSSTIEGYRGVGSYVSWPLDYFDDDISKALEQEANDKFFCFENLLWLIPEKNYIIRYIDHCKEINIEPLIMQIDTPRKSRLPIEQLNVIEVLGYDCITSVNVSYLDLEPQVFKKLFHKTYSKLNCNYLFDSTDDVFDFLNNYNKLLSNGIDLEQGNNPIPAMLSIVNV
ncbi:MAG: hypothetical protein PHV95_10960 [Eubacteriales bacterium]|nr:hypothetical protein [Eubacteriales bacterium]